MASGQSENAVRNATHKGEVKAKRLEASRPERHAAMQSRRKV